MRAQNRTVMKDYERKAIGKKPRHGPHNSEAIRMCTNAWYELDADRRGGFGLPGAIPFEALVTWARANRLDRVNFDLLRQVIRQLDSDRAIEINSKAKLNTKGKKR